MTEPQVRVLGPIQLIIDNRPVGLGATMLRAVLARLVAAGGHAITAERLIADLWEGNPPPTAASVLQVHIHNLRRLIEPDRPRRAPSHHLVFESSGYALRLAPHAVDAWHFEALLREYEQRLRGADRPDLRQRRRLLDTALACWSGAAYSGLTTFGWAAQDATRLTELRLTAAEMRAAVELDLDRPTEVTIELRALLDEYPEREEIARLLATAQYRLGQQTQALATLRHSREYLGGQYGIDPSPALRELESAILNHSETLTVPSAPAALAIRAAGERSDYTREYAVVRETARIVGAGRLRIVWIAGEAGAGKTTLTDTVLRDLAAESWTSLRGGCPEVDGAPPAWAWAEVLTDLDADAAETLAAGDAFSIAPAVVGMCKQRTGSGPVVILLEDAHRADTATLQVLRQVVNWLREEPVLLIVTLRGSEAEPTLHATAAALAHCTAERLELTGLDLSATRELARAAGLAELAEEELAQLHRRTGGNPLFLREMTKLLAAQRPNQTAEVIPDSIQGLISTRLHRLSPGVAIALQHLAIWGDGAELRMLAVSADIAEDELIDLVAEAEAAALVRTDRTGRITFDHALVHDTIYQRIPTLRRVRMHWNALELLEKNAIQYPGLARDPETLAHHAILGAGPENAALALEYVRAATTHSTERGMRGDTAQLWRSALELHELAGHTGRYAERPDREAVFHARYELVNALAYQGKLLDARSERQRAIELARPLRDPQALIRAFICWRSPSLWPVSEFGRPAPNLTDVLGALPITALPIETQIRLRASVILDTPLTELTAEHLHTADHLVRLARGTGLPELLCWTLNLQMFTRMQRDFRGPAEEVIAAAEAAGLAEYRALGHYGLYRACLSDCDLPGAVAQAALAMSEANEGQLRQLLDIVRMLDFYAAMIRGDLGAARTNFDDTFTPLAQRGVAELAAVRLFGELSLAWAQGDTGALVEPLRELYTAAPDYSAPIYTMALLDAGDLAHAREIYDRHPRVYPYLFPITTAVFRAHAAIAFGDRAEIRRMYEQLAAHGGAMAGLETGICVYFGPIDSTLAALSTALGGTKKAAIHQARAEALLLRMRTDLAAIDLELTRPRIPTRA